MSGLIFDSATKPARQARRGVTRVLEAVRGERYAQHTKWGEQTLHDGTGAPGDTDRAYWAKVRTDGRMERGTLSWRDVLHEEVAEAHAETEPAKLRAELVQVAAVAVAWVEAIDRRGDQ